MVLLIKSTNRHHFRALNELYSGKLEGKTMSEIEQMHPQEFSSRQRNKLMYRYPGPGGESYLVIHTIVYTTLMMTLFIKDVIERLRPTIVELERLEHDLMVITHQAVLRTILAYFGGIPLLQMPNIQVPLHTLYRLKPRPYGTDITKCNVDIY
jgi:6-phosphofructo-2-kinase